MIDKYGKLVDVINQPSTNMHVAGLAALVCGLCLPLDHVTAERSLIQDLVTNNITIDRYLDRLDQVRRSDEFTRAQHRALTHVAAADDVVQHWYDFEFTLLFNRTYDKIVRRLRPNQVTSASASSGPASVSQEQHQLKIDQYKELLLAQDKQLVDLRRRYEESEKRVAQLGQELNAYKIKSPQLGTNDNKLKEELDRREREITELKARVQSLEQKTAGTSDDQFLELRRLRQENEELKRVRDENKALQSRVSQLERDKNTSALSDSNLEVLSNRVKELTAELNESKEQYDALAAEQEELLVCLARAEMEKNDLKVKLGIADDEEVDEGEDE
jgi:myosin heavy subunit